MKRKLKRGILARALSRTPAGPLYSPEDPPGGGGGGPAPVADPPKTFTQADLDRITGQRIADERKKFADYETLKERAKKAEEHEAELTRLREEAETKGKSADEQARIAAERAARKIDAERAESATKLAAAEQAKEVAEKKLRTKVIEGALGEALDGAKVLSSARAKAIKALHDDSKVELDDDGGIASITYGGVAYKTTAEAATAFLKDNDFFKAGGVPPGGNTPRPGGNGAGPNANLYDLSEDQLLALDAQRAPRR
jgi:membrane protein involved in colicin uptake